VLLLLFSQGYAQQRGQLFPGARPLGLGGTFIGVADDGNAIYWNPAGLPYLNREEFHFMYSNLYGINIKNFYFSYTRPLMKKLALGVDWFRYGFNDNELDFSRNRWNVSIGYAINKYLSLGSNVKFLMSHTGFEHAYYGNGWGMGLDFGMLANYRFSSVPLLKELRAGLVVYDATDSWLSYDTGTREKIFPRSIRFGGAYKPFDQVSWQGVSLYDPLLAVDIDDRIHVGSEIWFFRDKFPMALRGGVQKPLHTDEGMTWSAGLSIRKSIFRIDYALSVPPVLPMTHRFSVALIYNFNPRLVEISDVRVEPIFSALYAHYNNVKNKIGKVTIRNKSGQPLENARVTFSIKDYTRKPAIYWQGRLDTMLTDADLYANFNENLLHTDQKETYLTGEVKVVYRYKNRSFPAKASVNVYLLGNQAIRWDQPERVAAFITPEDSLVRSFATSVNRDYRFNMAQWFLKRELADAIELYEALRAYHVAPTPDPNATYATATRDGFYIDTILFPDGLLSKPKTQRKGDCEDLAVLYASLLESIGIQTALLKTTGHIFMMFNTGIPAVHRFQLPVKDSLLVAARGQLWLPVETTLIRSPFVQAWETGAESYHSAKKLRDLEIIFTQDARQRFPSVTHAPTRRVWHEFPDSIQVQKLMSGDLDRVVQLKDQFIRKNFLAVLKVHPDSLELRNRLGCLYVGLSKFDAARREFETVLTADPGNAAALNNLGNLYFIDGELARARQNYEKCLQTTSFKTGTYVNLAILYQYLSEVKAFAGDARFFLDKSYEMLERVVYLLGPDSSAVLALLGISPYQITTTADQVGQDKKRRSVKRRILEAKKFINKSFSALVSKRRKIVKLEPGGPTGDLPDRDRQFILFWDYR